MEEYRLIKPPNHEDIWRSLKGKSEFVNLELSPTAGGHKVQIQIQVTTISNDKAPDGLWIIHGLTKANAGVIKRVSCTFPMGDKEYRPQSSLVVLRP